MQTNRPGEMAQQLIVLAALPEDLDLFAAPIRRLTTVSNSRKEGRKEERKKEEE